MANFVENSFIMKKSRIVAFIMLAVMTALSASAQDYSRYYSNLPVSLAQVSTFSLPDKTRSITEFGAKGDGVTLCTEAIQNAIDQLSSTGGGRIIFPKGIWLTGPIELKSNVNLHLERNAVIFFSPDKSLYIDKSRNGGRFLACISADKAVNISITGEGTIDGNGAQWRPVKRGKVSDVEWKNFKRMGGVERADGTLWYPWELKSGYPDMDSSPEKQEKRRNDLFRVVNCENIYLSGVTFQNAPKFHVHPLYCRNIIIDGITVRCPWNAQNGDAIDLSDCHRALIVNCIVDAGDDGLCMKSGAAKGNALVNGCEDILIQDNTVYHAHGGFVIGSEDVTAMKRIVVRDCTFSGTDTGLRFKSGVGRGGKTGDIYISSVMMTDIVGEAIVFQCDYVDRPAGSKESPVRNPGELKNVPEFTDIHISDIVCRGCRTGIAASGIEGLDCVHDITVENSTIVYTSSPTNINEATADLKLVNVNFVEDKK